MGIESFLHISIQKPSPGILQTNTRLFYILSCWLPRSPEVITLLVKAYYRTHSRLWTSVHPWTPSYFIYYVFGHEVQFPIFAYSNKHLLTSIQDTSVGVASLGALDRYDSLVERLQE